jgi:hypothetical protein
MTNKPAAAATMTPRAHLMAPLAAHQKKGAVLEDCALDSFRLKAEATRVLGSSA